MGYSKISSVVSFLISPSELSFDNSLCLAINGIIAPLLFKSSYYLPGRFVFLDALVNDRLDFEILGVRTLEVRQIAVIFNAIHRLTIKRRARLNQFAGPRLENTQNLPPIVLEI